MTTKKTVHVPATTPAEVADGLSSGVGERLSSACAAGVVAPFDAAAEQLFPPMSSKPSTADALAQHAALVARLVPDGALEQAPRMHRDALAANAAVANLFRTRETCDDVAKLVGSLATPASLQEAWIEAQTRAGTAARRTYQLAIARQLVAAAHELAPVAQQLLDAAAEEDSATAARAQAERDAAAQRELEEQERRDAARAARDALVARLREAQQAEQVAHAALDAAQAVCRKVKGEVLAARLGASGLETLRLRGGEVFGVGELMRAVPSMGPFDIDRFSAVLDRLEAEAAAS